MYLYREVTGIEKDSPCCSAFRYRSMRAQQGQHCQVASCTYWQCYQHQKCDSSCALVALPSNTGGCLLILALPDCRVMFAANCGATLHGTGRAQARNKQEQNCCAARCHSLTLHGCWQCVSQHAPPPAVSCPPDILFLFLGPHLVQFPAHLISWFSFWGLLGSHLVQISIP